MKTTLRTKGTLVAFLSTVMLLAGCSDSTSDDNKRESVNSPVAESAEELEGEGLSDTQLTQDYSVFGSLDHLIYSVIYQYGLNKNAVSVAVYHYPTESYTYLNEQNSMLAGSTTKVGVARLYADLIAEGILSWETELPYKDALYESGAGKITNGTKKVSYSIYDLVYYALSESDNTALNILFNYYQQNYGNVQQALVNLGVTLGNSELNTNNMASAEMLLNIISPVAQVESYAVLREALDANKDQLYFRQYVSDGMVHKYGSINGSLHDTGIYFENGNPIYALVVMTNGLGNVDEFLGVMNLRINEWFQYQDMLTGE